jgi:hypothetical protein
MMRKELEAEFPFRQPLNGFVLLRNDLRLPCYGQRQNTHGHRTQGENNSHFCFVGRNAKRANEPGHGQGIS